MSFATAAIAFASLGVQASKPFPADTLQLVGALGENGKPAALQFSRSKAMVLFFIATDCPIANRYAPEIGRISGDYRSKGVKFYRVYLSPGAPEATNHGKEYKLTMPLLLDPKKKLVEEIGVRVTPEAAVIGADGKLLYRGRIDNQNIEHGKARENYRKDLRIALDEILSGKPVSVKETVAIGCFVS